MYNRLRELVLFLARVPAAPQPPEGAPNSLRVFRAARNQFRLRLLGWAVAQTFTAIGIVISIGFIGQVKHQMGEVADERARPASIEESVQPLQQDLAQKQGGPIHDPRTPAARQLARRAPQWVLPLLIVGEVLGITLYLLQLPLTFMALRLDYEMRWYMVTDRSLRIRSGIWRVQESTMSFANIQQVEVRQGPVQRVLGIADVRVRSAGGGGSAEAGGKGHEDSLHVGVFHGVDNASEIRDLILDRLRRFRAAGLGDPDDQGDEPANEAACAGAVASPSAVTTAAGELLAAARELRAAVERRS